MEKISQLVDGELEAQECRAQIRRLTQDPELAQRWETYHLIRDVLRNEAGSGHGVVRQVAIDLEREATVLAPRTWLPPRAVRQTLPMAAAVAGVALVGWLALSFHPTSRHGDSVAVQKSSVQGRLASASGSVRTPPAPLSVRPSGRVNEYLLAHQEFSPTSVMQGGASYVRTVSTGDSDLPQ